MLRHCDTLQGNRILVIGDVMVDEYIWGKVNRISPEAPVPVVHVKSETMQLGGAANVVNNLRSLDAEVILVGVVGTDDLGRRVITALDKLGINSDGIIQSENHLTIRKTRIVAHNQQIVRVDRETISPIDSSVEARLIEFCIQKMEDVDGVVISDYAKGAITKNLARAVIDQAEVTGKICAVDPKIRNIDYYKGCTIITPNHLEASQITGVPVDDEWAIQKAGEKLLENLETDSVLVTCGEQGMALFETGRKMEMIDTVARSVYDVTGAGDTVISALTLALSAGMTPREAAVLANFAAGVVVGKVGTATATLPEIRKAMKVFIS